MSDTLEDYKQNVMDRMCDLLLESGEVEYKINIPDLELFAFMVSTAAPKDNGGWSDKSFISYYDG